jgi:hypothetical protein
MKRRFASRSTELVRDVLAVLTQRIGLVRCYADSAPHQRFWIPRCYADSGWRGAD